MPILVLHEFILSHFLVLTLGTDVLQLCSSCGGCIYKILLLLITFSIIFKWGLRDHKYFFYCRASNENQRIVVVDIQLKTSLISMKFSNI